MAERFVIDGDTLIEPDGTRTRIAGVDSPETFKVKAGKVTYGQPGAQVATDILSEQIAADPTIETKPTGEKSYDRQVADLVDEDGNDLSQYLVGVGAARPTRFSDQEQIDSEGTALARSMGIGEIIDDPAARADQQRMQDSLGVKGLTKFDQFKGAQAMRGEDLNAFGAAANRGADNTQGLLYSAANALGALTGSDAIEKWGEEGFKQQMLEAAAHPPIIESFDDVDSLSELGTYVAEALGEQVPNMALMATGAGSGAVLARAALGKAVLGRMVGTTAATYPLAVGEVQQELTGAGIDEPGTAFIAGIPIAAMDALGFEAMVGRFFGKASKEVSHGIIKEVSRGLFKGAGLGAASEIPTEMAQELLAISARAYHDPSFEIFSDENIARIKEAGIKAGIVGAAVGGGGGSIHSAVTYEGKADANTVPPQDTPSANTVPPQDTPSAEPTATDPAGQPTDAADPLAPEAQSTVEPNTVTREPNTTQQVSAAADTTQQVSPRAEDDRLEQAYDDDLLRRAENEPFDLERHQREQEQAQEYVPNEADAEMRALLEKSGLSKVRSSPSPLADPAPVAQDQTDNTLSSEDSSLVDDNNVARPTAETSEPIIVDVPRKEGNARSKTAARIAALFSGATVINNGAKANWQVSIDPDAHADSKGYDGDTKHVLEQTVKVFDDGGSAQDKRVELKMPDGTTERANWMEIIKLGAATVGRPFDSNVAALKQARDNFSEGVAFLAEKGVTFPPIKDNTVVLRAGGKNVTFGELGDVSNTLNKTVKTLEGVEKKLRGNVTVEERRRLTAQRTKLKRAVKAYGINPSSEKNAGLDSELGDTADTATEANDPKGYDAGVETEATQASKSSSTKQRGKNLPKETVTVTAQFLGAKYKDLVTNLLSHIGVDSTEVHVVDEGGARTLIKQLKSEGKSTKHLEQVLKDKPRGRIIVAGGKALVFISRRNTTDDAKVAVILHELGHLVQFTALDQAPKNVQAALREASGTKNEHEFGEWFANQLGYWTAARKVPRGIVNKFFHGLAKKLKAYFDLITKNEGLSTTYADFMDVMVGYRMSALSKVRPKTDFGKQLKKDAGDVYVAPGKPNGNVKVADFSVREAVSNAITERRLQRLVEVKDHTVKWLTIAKPLIQTADGYLRSLKSEAISKLANHFHHAVGTARTEDITIPQETRSYAGPQAEKMHALLKKVDKLSEVEQKALVDELIEQREEVSELGGEVREYFNGMYSLLTNKLKLRFKHRKNYFPLTLDMQVWSERRDDVIAIIAKNYNGDEAAATRIYEEMRDSGGEFSVDDDGKVNLAGPSFGNMKARNMDLKFIQELSEFFVRDLHAVMVAYTHSAIRRGVIEKRFGIKSAQEHEAYSILAKANQITDVDLSSPLAKFAMEVRLAHSRGEITESEANRILNKVLPAYMGRLGADISPALRHLNSWGVLYQNIRLLGLSVLSSFVDIGTIMYRSGKPLKALTTVLEGALSKAKRKDMMDAARMMGEIRDDVADHVLNDQMTQEFMSPTASKINDWFFRKIGMQGYTNFTRAVALSMGKQVFAGKPTKAQMKELGISYEELSAWQEAHSPTNLAESPQHENVIGALHQFIDESIIRPDAAIRPVWGSDPRFMLIWHLKSFIYGFQKQILDRVWEQTKAKPWPTKAIPGITLGLMLLPFAAAGYELRRFITGADGYSREKQGWEYAGELMQRSGATGLLQFMIDAEESSNRGRMGIVAFGGPSVEQLTTALTKDWSYIWSHGLPVFAQSPAARAWARD